MTNIYDADIAKVTEAIKSKEEARYYWLILANVDLSDKTEQTVKNTIARDHINRLSTDIHALGQTLERLEGLKSSGIDIKNLI